MLAIEVVLIMKPKVEVFTDEHEEKAGKAYEEFFEKGGAPENLITASKEFALSSNPDGKKMATLCMAVFFRAKGVNEKDNNTAIKWLEKALKEFRKIEEQHNRDRVWAAWYKLGGSTTSYDVISSRLFGYLLSSIDTMIEFIDKNPKLLKLGKF